MAQAVQRSEHDNKYDRQMRLWGGHGQKRLEMAHILCLGSGPTASETLKNLVLPNVGQFTLVDDAVVTEADLGNNWFVDEAGLGRPRAEVVTELLIEMNDSVKGHPVVKNPQELVSTDPTFLKKFDVVIASCLDGKLVREIADICERESIPLIVVRAYGLVGYARLQTPDICVQETHYDNDRYDLYVTHEQLEHFSELRDWINSFDIEGTKDSMEHSHLPYIVILGQAIQKWVKEKGSSPSSFKETKEFKAMLKAGKRAHTEENFDEAVQFAHRAYYKPQFDVFSQKVLSDCQAKNITTESKEFWVLVAALNRFIANEGNGFAPVVTSLPDMVSQTKDYIKLKNIFKDRAAKDLASITKHVRDIEKETGRTTQAPDDSIAFFTKNCRGLQLIRVRTLAQEEKEFDTEAANEIFEEWQEEPEGEDDNPPRALHWYLALRAADRFATEKSRLPGTGSAEVEEDEQKLIEVMKGLYEECKISVAPDEDVAKEIVRYGASEVHNIAAFVGGVGAQVCLKVILQQYSPLNHTLIFDGVHGICKSFAV